jgi:hypothetical protein
LLLWLLLSVAVAAESTEIFINTDPQGALVLDQYGNEIGHTGKPIIVDLSIYGSTLEATLDLPGYESKLERIKTRQVKELGHYPPEGAIALRATSFVVTLRTALSENKAAAGGGLFALLLCSAWGLSRHAKTKHRLQRAAVLEEIKARAEELKDNLMGKTLGGYRLAELLGEGGTARVYRALPEETLNSEQAVAVKVLNPESDNDPEFRQRFKREVTIWKDLMHPHIVTFIDWDEQDGLIFLVTEILEGDTLRGEFKKGPRAAKSAMNLLRPVFEAVSYAHENGVVHRDLKPENILTTATGKAKVSDFGLARIGAEDKVTKTGSWVGTPEYMSPEQVQGLTLDPRTDQYALGTMLYELVAGNPPFTGDDQVAIIFKQVSSAPTPLKSVQPDLPDTFCEAVGRMLAKKPEDRFLDLKQALEALEQACV